MMLKSRTIVTISSQPSPLHCRVMLASCALVSTRANVLAGGDFLNAS
eukprot:SAG31_NODE_1664_length_7585_cov_10.994523_11_plen_47_part_00